MNYHLRSPTKQFVQEAYIAMLAGIVKWENEKQFQYENWKIEFVDNALKNCVLEQSMWLLYYNGRRFITATRDHYIVLTSSCPKPRGWWRRVTKNIAIIECSELLPGLYYRPSRINVKDKAIKSVVKRWTDLPWGSKTSAFQCKYEEAQGIVKKLNEELKCQN